MLELAVLADDLTGGMIIASMLEAEGVVCPLVTDVEQLAELPPTATAVVLARKIRLIPASAARAEARAAVEAFRKLGARTVFQKYSAVFDSTAEGNIGPIAEVMLDATGAKRTVFSAAYAERGVTVYKGQLFLGPMLASDTVKRFDPATPAFTSDLVVRLRQQTARPVGLLDHERLKQAAAGADPFAHAPDTPFWIADSVDAAEVDLLAELVRDWPFVTGADSLPPAILRARCRDLAREQDSGRRLLAGSPGHEAVLAGSCGQATIEQLAVFERRHPVWRVDLVRDEKVEDLAGRIAAWAADRLPAGPVAVATTADQAGVEAAQAAFGRAGAAQRADGLMGKVAQRLQALGVAKFVVAGGETSGAVLGALGVRRLEVCAYDDELFGGYCRAVGGAPLSFVVKPGSMGAPDFFASAFARLRGAEASPQGNDA